MEITTLFTEQKWNILQSLSKERLSPLQLAQSSNTSIANISQQLRLLEAADLVSKEKIKNRDKGKPRTLFSLTNDYAYLISTMKNFAEKKLLVLTDFHKVILRILYLENPELHYFLSKLYWKIENMLDQISCIAVIQNQESAKIIIVAEKISEIEKKILTLSPKTKEFSFEFLSVEEFSKSQKSNKLAQDNIHPIYDPQGITVKKDQRHPEIR